MIDLSASDIERFNGKYEAVTESGCWVWTTGRFRFGHGAFKLNGKTLKAHRVSYEIHNGEIPDGMCILHRCDVPECVNPAHLFIGTKGDNAKDRDSKGRTTCGEKSHLAKLTREQVEAIRKDKTSSLKLASVYEISSSNIRTIRRAETWK